jgi:hypothetical protein
MNEMEENEKLQMAVSQCYDHIVFSCQQLFIRKWNILKTISRRTQLVVLFNRAALHVPERSNNQGSAFADIF